MAPATAEEPIRIFNRRTREIETEKVCGGSWIDLIYGTAAGRRLARSLLSRPAASRAYGWLQRHPCSRRSIAGFVRQYHIDLVEAQIPPGGFGSFNDFFIRKLKSGARPVESDPWRLTSPADSRLQVFEIRAETWLAVKKSQVTLKELLGLPDLETSFEGGIALVFRLAPCDYHRFGFVADGIQSIVKILPGELHSVSPLALRHIPTIHFSNLRHVSRITAPMLGAFWQVEVGAMFVGSIVQHRPAGGPCRRGEEKGYFQFGGSTVIAIFQAGRIAMDQDILYHSAQGIETLVRYGEAVGTMMPAVGE
jgi:phosphatidylserine decarboxylase